MTKVYRDARNSWAAEDCVDINGTLQLTILTMKRHNGVVSTTAQCGRQEGDCVVFYPFSDYSVTVKADRTLRCTEKNVTAQHIAIMQGINDIKADIMAFYAKAELTTA